MSAPDPTRIAAIYLARRRTKTAGEVIFKKDRGDDVGSWAYNDVPPSKREIPRDFNYAPGHQKPLAQVLRSSLAALGYALTAYHRFARLKSSRLSPDGSLGGRGYIQKIPDMRKQYMNCVEAMSSLSDTLYDEINAPHWALFSRQEDDEEKAEVSALIEDAQTIRDDPEEWAEKEMSEDFDDDKPEKGVEVEENADSGEMMAGADEKTKKNESDPDAWMNPPAAFAKRASRLAIGRIARRWASTQPEQIEGGRC